jgi:predicted acyltransferase
VLLQEQATVATSSDGDSDDQQPAQSRRRIGALDAVRGLAVVVMLLVMNPGPAGDLPAELQHAAWHGLTIADVAFPLFLFAVGASMTLSRRGLDPRHVAYRATVLAALGVGLASLKYEELHPTGVLQHIAGAYVLAFGVLRLPRRFQAPVTVGIVVALWAAFVAWAGPGGDPWGESGTFAHAVDTWVLGQFSAEGVISTVASSVTVLGGAWAGRLITGTPDPQALMRALSRYAVALVALGVALSFAVPLNKRLWTPSYTVVTLGVSFALLAAGFWLIDIRRTERVARPLLHLGANPTLIYLLSMSVLFLLRNGDLTLDGSDVVSALAWAGAWVGLWWLLAWGLHRRQIFLRV